MLHSLITIKNNYCAKQPLSRFIVQSHSEEQKYLKRKETKKRFYEKNQKKLIELTDKDIENLDDVMPIKLRPFLPPTFSFD